VGNHLIRDEKEDEQRKSQRRQEEKTEKDREGFRCSQRGNRCTVIVVGW